MTEASAYTPPSRDPADIAARLETYIARNKAHTERHVQDEAGIPKVERGVMARLFLHIRRLEHQMRCFILFLAAELIARGLVNPQPLSLRPRGEADPSGPSAMIRRQDRELRAALSGEIRLNTFSITTPVFGGTGGRKTPRTSTPYTLMPDGLQPVDARHLLARYGRLARVLLRADSLAERLAGRALTVKMSSSPIPAQAGNSLHRTGPDSRLRGNERTTLSASHREPRASDPGEAEGQANQDTNPLYLSALHSWLAPEALWESARHSDDERGDLTALHLMASESVSAAGFPPGPDPKLRLPRFEAWRPPDPPQVRFI